MRDSGSIQRPHWRHSEETDMGDKGPGSKSKGKKQKGGSKAGGKKQ